MDEFDGSASFKLPAELTQKNLRRAVFFKRSSTSLDPASSKVIWWLFGGIAGFALVFGLTAPSSEVANTDFLLAAMSFLIAFLITYGINKTYEKEKRLVESGIAVTGRIVELKEENLDGPEYWLHYEYQYNDVKHRKRVQLMESWQVEQCRQSETVTVLLDVKQPTTSTIYELCSYRVSSEA